MGFLLDESGVQLLDEAGQPLFDEGGDPRLTPVPPVDPSVIVIPQPVWTWVLADPAPSVSERLDLKTAYGRRVTFRIDGISDAQFSMHGSSPEAAEITEMSTDVVAYRTNQQNVVEKLHRGRIITETDDVNQDNHWCQFSTNDYRGMLQNRLIGIAGYDSGVDVPINIINALINTTQSLPGGNWGITSGTVASPGLIRIQSVLSTGANLLEAITNLGHLDSTAFEWEIDANLKLNVWFPQRGTATGITLDWGGIVTAIRRTSQVSSFGNVAIVGGDGRSTTPVVQTSFTVATDPQGRWERFVSYTDIADPAVLLQRAIWMLKLTNTLRPQYVVTLAPGRWDRSKMWLGDIVTLMVHKGRLDIDELQRIIEINVAISDNGTEDVQLGLLPV